MIKKYHVLYKTTNILSGEFYIGIHSTNDLEDNYLGSGHRIRALIKKYKREKFIREILKFCSTRAEVCVEEKKYLTDKVLCDFLCLNLGEGGQGGALNKWTDESKLKLSESLKKRPMTWGDKVSKANKGKRPSLETLEKQRLSRLGSGNPGWVDIDIEKLKSYKEQNLSIREIAKITGLNRTTISRRLASVRHVFTKEFDHIAKCDD